MKKVILILSLILMSYSEIYSQGISINTSGNSPDTSAILDVSSTIKGQLIPRMTTAQRNAIVTPALSLMIFNIDDNCFQIYINSIWQNIFCDISCSAPPSMPGSISGNNTVCENATGEIYNIPQVPGALSYTWTVPTGATIVAGQGTTGIAVNFGANSGNITVIASNNCGVSSAQTFAMTVNPVPSPAGSISGTASVCATQSGVSYSVGAISGATGYTWSYDGSGFTIVGGNNTNNITADFSGATGGNLTVYGTNACGNGNVSPDYTISIISSPSAPTASTHTPSPTQIVWNWNAVAGATGYKWNTVNNYGTATDMGSSTTKTETGLTCNTAYTRYVWAYNSCGNSSSVALNETTSACSCPEGTGGTITHSGGKTIHTFTSSGTFTPGCAGDVEVLVVAGGGGSGNGGGGGGAGGGGGVIYDAAHAVTVQGYTVTVGAGGASGNSYGQNGQNSVFDNLTALGGGGGAGGGGTGNGLSGGSGGGALGSSTATGGSGTAGQGYKGGNTFGQWTSAGGGGAGAEGNPPSGYVAGNGGNGISSSISGSSQYYGGGGGGSAYFGNPGNAYGFGGLGGGGNGCNTANCCGQSGTANTGGGAGGNCGCLAPTGGSGIVIISYTTP